MTDRIAEIASSTSPSLHLALKTALDQSRAEFDVMAVRAVLDEIERKDISTDRLRQLEAELGLTEGSLDALQAQLERDHTADFSGVLASLYLASAAWAAASVGHIINPNSQALQKSGATVRRDLIHAYVDETALALRDAAARITQATGDAVSKARHLYRTIGLSRAQSKLLDVMRSTIFNHLNAPTGITTDPKLISQRVTATRGLLSAPQQAMLRKAFENGLTPDAAEKLLDRHATALRNHRAKVAADHIAHATANAGELRGWQAAQRAGALPKGTRRYWRTAGDERVRHAHNQVPAMNPTGVPLNASFKTPLGERMFPPLEINCRCRVHLRPPEP